MESQTDQDIAIAQAKLTAEIRQKIADQRPADWMYHDMHCASRQGDGRIPCDCGLVEPLRWLPCGFCAGLVKADAYACHRCGWKVGA